MSSVLCRLFLFSLLYYAKTSDAMKLLAVSCAFCREIQCPETLCCYHFEIVQSHPMSGNCTFLSFLSYTTVSEKSTLLSRILSEDIQCQESYNSITLKICIVPRHQNVRKVTVTIALHLYCAKTSNIRKVYIAIAFVLCEDIQCQETVHCYYFCIVQRKRRACTISVNSTLLLGKKYR